jgi:hypothetical protein
MAADLARNHRVVVPDLRRLGLSAKPPGGFDKKTQAGGCVFSLRNIPIRFRFNANATSASVY